MIPNHTLCQLEDYIYCDENPGQFRYLDGFIGLPVVRCVCGHLMFLIISHIVMAFPRNVPLLYCFYIFMYIPYFHVYNAHRV